MADGLEALNEVFGSATGRDIQGYLIFQVTPNPSKCQIGNFLLQFLPIRQLPHHRLRVKMLVAYDARHRHDNAITGCQPRALVLRGSIDAKSCSLTFSPQRIWLPAW